MPRAVPIIITAAVEGLVEEAVVRRLLAHVGALLGPVHGKNGKGDLRRGLHGYNVAAQRSPWLVLVDLNHEADCAPPFRADWLPNPAPGMCFRVVVREIEAWLLADRERLSQFLAISPGQIPADPERVEDPKGAMVELAKHSRRREVRENMPPRPGSKREVGPAYTARLIEFVERNWRPEIAARRADSLRRCLARLREIARGGPLTQRTQAGGSKRSTPAALARAKCHGAGTVTITRNEILTALNKPDEFILAIVPVDADAPATPRYVRRPFQREPDFGVTSVNYALDELMARAEDPA